MKTLSSTSSVIVISVIIAAIMGLSSCGRTAGNEFFRVENGRFVKDGRQINFIGANVWYAPFLAADGEYGDRQRLAAELDSLKAIGVTNLRVIAGAEGADGTPYKVAPTLQKAPGVYDTTMLQGLDWLMAELGKRDMSAVLYLNNTWEWSGGYGTYLEWAGAGKSPLPIPDGWVKFSTFVSKFVTDDRAKALFADHVRYMVSRTNTVTGVPYKDDPAIFSWQICNEPRCLSASDSVRTVFAGWIRDVAALIKSIDPNHLVSTGSEGYYGCEADLDLFKRVHSSPDIDYLNIHIWPYNWNWVDKATIVDSTAAAIRMTDWYLDMHLPVAEELGKPVVIEEFGYPRDGLGYSKDVPVTARNVYYSHIFDRLLQSVQEGGMIAGVNFWAWGGEADQSDDRLWWKPGDDYCGDPAQEPQGYYSVYASDTSTVSLIRNANRRLSTLPF